MKRILAHILLLSLAAVFAAAQPLPDILAQEAEKSILELSHGSAFRRKCAVERLTEIGAGAFPVVARSYRAQEFSARRQLTSVLGGFDSAESRNFLLSVCLLDKDSGVRSRASLALLEMSDRFPELAGEVAKLQPADPEIRESLETFRRTLVYKSVERTLGEMISAGGGWGFYQGQFDPILPLGEEAIPVLLGIFAEEDYRFVTAAYNRDPIKIETIRLLAGDAIGHFGPCMKEHRSRAIFRLQQMRSHKNQQLWEVATYSLYRLGQKEPLETLMHHYQLQILRYRNDIDTYMRVGAANVAEDFRRELSSAYSNLAMIHLRIDENEKAIETLNQAIESNPLYALNYYNLACAHACAGDIGKGLEALRNAVEKGYDDLNWMYQDGDLSRLREDPRFEEITVPLRRNKKKQ